MFSLSKEEVQLVSRILKVSGWEQKHVIELIKRMDLWLENEARKETVCALHTE